MALIKDRDYQERDILRIENSWELGNRCPLYCLPTGGGKTHTFSRIIKRANVPATVIAHRTELVEQISIAIAKQGIPHRIVGPDKTAKRIMQSHIKELGRSFYDPRSTTAVAGVDSLIRIDPKRDQIFETCQLWVQDEGHHVLRSNKWGKAAAMFPNARGLLVTATPERADGKGLGAHAAGLADDLIVGPSMQELIDRGFLSPFRIYGIPSRIRDTGDLKLGASGDFTLDSMRRAFENSGMVGDLVGTYLQRVPGLREVTFVPDVEDAHRVADAFNRAGVPAVALSAKTPDDERAKAIQDLAAGRILQIVNVDLLGEGFDCPAIESVRFARPTESYAVYAQQFGRALRLFDGKKVAYIFDHVGNVLRHNGPPTQPRIWTLDGTDGRSKPSDAIALRYCPDPVCALPYERFHHACPYCGAIPAPPSRSEPMHVDGDLIELDPETLNEIMARRDELDQDVEAKRAQLFTIGGNAAKYRESHLKHHIAAQQAQRSLRYAMELWGGKQQAVRGIGRRDAQRLFYLTYGVDVLTATTLKTADATALLQKIMGDL